jgi:hypothetical protein
VISKTTKIPFIMVISIISILVLNACLAPMRQLPQQMQLRQSYSTGEPITKTSYLNQDIKQHIDEQNTCHRGGDCEQADEGQQVGGNENSAAGLNDQGKNIQQR